MVERNYSRCLETLQVQTSCSKQKTVKSPLTFSKSTFFQVKHFSITSNVCSVANTPAKQKKKFNGDNTNDMEKNEKSALVAVFREKLNWKKQALAESNSYLLK